MNPATPATLFHYTCGAHGAPGITRQRIIQTMKQPLLGRHIAWFTDLSTPDRWALGLTGETLCCDRTEYRATVSTEGTDIVPWWRWARELPHVLRELFEYDGLCMHWWVSENPVIPQRIQSRDEYTKAGAT